MIMITPSVSVDMKALIQSAEITIFTIDAKGIMLSNYYEHGGFASPETAE